MALLSILNNNDWLKLGKFAQKLTMFNSRANLLTAAISRLQGQIKSAGRKLLV